MAESKHSVVFVEPPTESRGRHSEASTGHTGWRERLKASSLGVWRIVVQHPVSTLLPPLLLLGLILGLGIWGVNESASSYADTAKVRAYSLAQDTAAYYQREMVGSVVAPVLVTSAMVHYNPNYQDVGSLFQGLAPTLLAQTSNKYAGGVELQLLPFGVVAATYPAANSSSSRGGTPLGSDIFASPERDMAIKMVRARSLTLAGPMDFMRGGFGVIITMPIFITGVPENTTFNNPYPLNPACGEACAYNATTRTAFWGFATAKVWLDIFGSEDTRFGLLVERGYNYEVLVPDGAGGQARLASNTEGALPGDSVEVTVQLPNTQWVLRVHPTSGWTPTWYAGLLAGIIVLAVVVAVLAFAVLVSRRQHQTLLEAVLPKEVIRELRKEDNAVTMEARILQADTPADMLLMVLGELLEGRTPDLRDVVFIRTVLMRNQDVYAPLNLRGHLRGSSLDADVVRALMRQLGSGHDFESTSMYGSGRIAEEEADHSDGGGGGRGGGGGHDSDSGGYGASGGGSGGTEGGYPKHDPFSGQPAGSVEGALSLILNVQPYHAVRSVAGEVGGGLSGCGGPVLNMQHSGDSELRSPVVGAFDVEPSGGAITGVLVAASLGSVVEGAAAVAASGASSAETRSRWRGGGKKTPLKLSSNGRPGLPCGPPQPLLQPVAIPPTIIEDSEKVLRLVDSWEFDTWALQEATQGHALSVLGFYLMQRAGLVSRFRLKPVVLARLLRAIESGYLDNPYHSAIHAADVLQTLHVIIHSAQLHVHYLDALGLLASYYAAIVHDFAHPGLTGDFLIATSDPLAIRYNDRSPLENHHCAASFGLLRRRELDALAPLSQSERSSFRKQVIELVLATDMKQHFSILSHFNTVHRLTSYSQQQAAAALQPSPSLARAVSLRPNGSGDRNGGIPPPSPRQPLSLLQAPQPVDDTERLLSLQIALKCADIGHLGESLEVHKKWLANLEEEFFRQGDKERELGIPISPLFDRSKQGVSKSQVGFYDFVGLPLVHALSSAFPGSQQLMRCFLTNYNHWRQVDGQPPVEPPRARTLSGQGSGRQLIASVSNRLLSAAPSTPRGNAAAAAAAARLDRARPPPLTVPAAPGAEDKAGMASVQLTLAGGKGAR
ncbi:hypothetical protein HYH02_007479 [Chlamydomonas schloesseri]|uniref:Phosphodiesterase n=1 Tax=Chlamydomonas schloesseri TaxID=2026947 RepID=A0A835WIF8_9CHLO|nr:hypothetical protein HYH02_007479 [Chlamydomonas schloesseri]|eukprot:KAG2447555.1 hypothetical protein HYH02_007479 [Chlamydomonas schloesseri]